MIPRVLKNFNLFVDGRGYAGVIEQLTLPKLTTQMEEYRGGGMDAPVEIDLGQEKLECTFQLFEYDPNVVRLWGLADGAATQVTARGGLRRDGEAAVPIVVNMRGVVKEMDAGDWTAGEKTSGQFMMALRYIKVAIDGQELIEVDVVNMIRKVGGTDQLESIRAAIGI
ncbi:phage major tail tube protein [Synechococcus elongatus]|uniref:Phage major tail tube protein n=1 Tax=Synechococcus elongatus (strain ATCC 33912 / PCC 7942 / FACHB-805) TaxID=1140 RepID=Q31Q89_SYNE7|nr:phage major tail tube protein [Synechococcus elongatus]ABB56780.1 Phage major tail tube protein [Synechococcus elongatus PCC 7942 = FACHB-805]AJD58679.1 major tail tube protein [Synechococcus elongatus UTEX 2973]MBD2588644.1 phage major tail tube protein [Synechococcus elongatus FACHB-242]MBD2689767.1 phage major tail tube protein [Synechococcus elongatus FACHB-1061]MBD2708374.1 phage major tail tube protein [Synechococcus elongatus PCC 7942 = FACHB-805]